MISLIRIQTQEKPDLLWNEVLSKRERLQEALGNKGRLLYVSKRYNYNEASIFVHATDTNVLANFISDHLSKLNGVTAIWLINMLKPVFFPFGKETDQVKRYTITLKVFPSRLSEVYERLAKMELHGGMKMVYFAYTFHLFGDAMQFSLLSEDGAILQKYVKDVIDNIPGVLQSTVCEIERTHHFISHEEWCNDIL